MDGLSHAAIAPGPLRSPLITTLCSPRDAYSQTVGDLRRVASLLADRRPESVTAPTEEEGQEKRGEEDKISVKKNRRCPLSTRFQHDRQILNKRI
jgi:hypothetical protein